MDYFGQEQLYAILKPLTTISIMMVLFIKGTPNLFRFKSLLVLAFLFCLIGDIFLLNDNYFVFGLGSFLIGHLCFASGFIQLEGFQTNRWIFLLLVSIGVGLFLWLRTDLEALTGPVALYVLVTVFMAWQGASLYFKRKQSSYALIGIAVLLFMFSDTVIAINKFKTAFEFAGAVILTTYWLSIALIANASYNILDGYKK